MFSLFIFGFALFIDGISKSDYLSVKTSNKNKERRIRIIIGILLIMISFFL